MPSIVYTQEAMTTRIPMWSDTLLILYHGCRVSDLPTLLPNGKNNIDPTKGRIGLDFGQGFYTTSSPGQAVAWATAKSKKKGERPAVVSWKVRRELLAKMETLAFTHYKLNEDFFPFVEYCRGGAKTHGRSGTNPNFDVVYGPLMSTTANEPLRDKVPFTDRDQISFHSSHANALLENPLVVCGNPDLTTDMLVAHLKSAGRRP